MPADRRWSSAASPLVPAGLTLFLGFRAGGFFPDEHGLVALAAVAALVLWVTLAGNPLAGATPALVVAVGALVALAAWMLVSATWSDAQGRALLDYTRALAYALVVLAVGLVPRAPGAMAWSVRALAAALVIVCGAGLVTRIAPDVWSVPPSAATDRLSYPLTYWNGLGVAAGIATVLLVHLTTSLREPRVVRVLAAGAVPVVVAALYFTFSRGGILAGIVGVALYLVIGRPAGWATGLLPAAGAAALVVVDAVGADALSSSDFDTPTGIEEGHALARLLALVALGAIALRAAALPLDARITAWTAGRPPWPRQRVAAGWVAGLAVAAVALTAVGVPGYVERQYERFVEVDLTEESDQRQRLLNPANNGRLDHWRVALDRFEEQPVRGTGAGTYETLWAQDRELRLNVLDAHSLYVELLAELGVVGLVLMVVALGTLGWGFARLARGPDRGPGAALLAAAGAWALHAGIDWDWELPATGAWLFAAGGLALAAPPGAARLGPPGRVTRLAIAVGCLVIAVLPAQVVRSQWALEAAERAYARGDCATAIDRSLASLRAVAARPAPYELLGFCDVRLGYEELAVRNLERAVDRDPDAWQRWYGLALVRAATGRDPRSAADRARALNPLSSLPQQAVEAFEDGGPERWRRRARRLPLPPR